MARRFFLLLTLGSAVGCADRAARRETMTNRNYPPAATLSPRPALLTRAGVTIYNGGYGSGFARHPGDANAFYLLTDRGPNYQMPEKDHKTFPAPTYVPMVGLFRLSGDSLTLENTIRLRSAQGRPLTGIPMPPGRGGTGETPLDTLGNEIPFDAEGIDAEGLAAMADGSFWIADEYGPGLLHVDATGKVLERISPRSGGAGKHSLPAVLLRRQPNRGFEGLAVTPDQKHLAAILEAPLENPRSEPSVGRITRLVLLDLESGQTRQYAYVLEQTGVTNNGMAANGGASFLVLERDDKFPGDSADPSTFKRVYRIDLAGATDLSDSTNSPTGRLFGGKTLEQLEVAELAAHGIVPVSKTLVTDLLAPGLAYPHNKPEGVALIDRRTIAVVNDDDFGITDDGSGGIRQKILPLTGQPDQTTVRFIPVPDPLY
jgi:hypothetical protein